MIPERATEEVVALGFSQVVGLRAWSPAVGVGSFLTLEFGSPRVTSAGVTQGSFHLWIYGASWLIRQRGDLLTTSEDNHAVMLAGAQAMKDAVMRGFEFDPDVMTLTLRFDPDLDLVITPLGDAEMEEWFLYLDDGTVITAGPGRSILRESAAGSTTDSGA